MRSHHGISLVLVVGALALVACGGGGRTGDAGTGSCITDLDCDDGLDCTLDACSVDRVCVHDPIDERCDDGQSCDPGRGCVSSSSCSSDAECDDGHECTIDRCGVGGICTRTPLDERCAAGEVCDSALGCMTPAGCSSAAECDDGVACTNDSCGVDRTCSNTPVDSMCDEGVGERCNSTIGCFVPMPCDDASDCDDGNFCNGAEVCDPEFGCGPAETPRVCDDSDDCTVDSCDSTANMCVFACDRERTECGCPGPGVSCNGRFSLPGATGNCFGLFTWDFSNVTFTNTAGVIEITGWTVSTTATVPPMADPGPACPNVDASTTLGAGGGMGCSETYRIMGTFSDDDTFTGTFSATFDGFCASCSMTVPLTGTRL